MKTIFTLLLLVSFTGLFSQIQLDSIVSYDVDDGEVRFIQIFTYDEDGKLIRLVEPSYSLKVDFFYTQFGEFDQIDVYDTDDNEKFLEANFIYDSNQIIDTISYYDPIGEGVEAFWEFVKEGGKVIELKSFLPDDLGDNLLISTNKYTYTDDLLTQDDTYFYDDDGSELHLQQEELSYEGDQLIKLNYVDPNYNDYTRYDSLLYDTDGNIVNHMRIDFETANPDEVFIENTFISYENGVHLDAISNPKKFFDFVELINSDDYFLPVLALKNEKPLAANSLLEGLNYGFFYSVFVGLEEERQAASPITVYPNPTSEFIKIDQSIEIEQFDIYSISGEKLQSQSKFPSNSEQQIINVKQLSQGMYKIVLRSTDGVYYFSSFVKK